MERIKLMSPECAGGCSPCFLDCAMTRIAISSLDREIETLRREQPLRQHRYWPDWSEGHREAQAHMRVLQTRLAGIVPSYVPMGEPTEAMRQSAAPAYLH